MDILYLFSKLVGVRERYLAVEDHIYLLSYPHHVEGHQDGYEWPVYEIFKHPSAKSF